jgi:hypothetical protein
MQQTGAVNFSEGLKARASGWFAAEIDAGFTSSPANVGQDKDSDKRQHQAIEAFAGFEILGEFYDQAVSGADSLDQRPGFAAMLEQIAGTMGRTIIVETANQFARDLITGHRDHRLGASAAPQYKQNLLRRRSSRPRAKRRPATRLADLRVRLRGAPSRPV